MVPSVAPVCVNVLTTVAVIVVDDPAVPLDGLAVTVVVVGSLFTVCVVFPLDGELVEFPGYVPVTVITPTGNPLRVHDPLPPDNTAVQL
jgi:hypothetical protein